MKQNALLAKSIKEGDEAAFELFFRAPDFVTQKMFIL